jgi:pyridoxine kinase
MARILSISSQVVRGHVGNSAAVPALQRLGHEVWPLPTVVLSNHPGHAKVAGTRIPPETMIDMAQALAGNGWLGAVDAVSTGYLPTPEHVLAAARIVEMVVLANPQALVLADPVLGDDPEGLYIDEQAARSVRTQLLPFAGVATPNRFELAWLSGQPVTGAASAIAAAATLGVPIVLATSIPSASGDLVNLLWSRTGVIEVAVPRLAKAPHGTGDLLAALYLGAVLKGSSAETALKSAVAGVRAAIEASQGADELRLI